MSIVSTIDCPFLTTVLQSQQTLRKRLRIEHNDQSDAGLMVASVQHSQWIQWSRPLDVQSASPLGHPSRPSATLVLDVVSVSFWNGLR